MAAKKSLILLTNDDGYYADGISALSEELKNMGQIYIVAPDQEKSASSLALTLHHPLRVKAVRKNRYAVSGTPADCVYLAVQKFLPRLPDLLISGINHGPNLGQQDTSYSGTVAGAKQGAFLDIPSMAVSLIPDKDGRFSFGTAARIVAVFAKKLLKNPLPRGTYLNVDIQVCSPSQRNIPECQHSRSSSKGHKNRPPRPKEVQSTGDRE